MIIDQWDGHVILQTFEGYVSYASVIHRICSRCVMSTTVFDFCLKSFTLVNPFDAVKICDFNSVLVENENYVILIQSIIK